MSGIDYATLKNIVNMCTMPAAILSVEKKEDGTCGEIIMVATNDKFSMTGENVEGKPYSKKYYSKQPGKTSITMHMLIPQGFMVFGLRTL